MKLVFQVLRFGQVNANSLLEKVDYISVFAKDGNLAVVTILIQRYCKMVDWLPPNISEDNILNYLFNMVIVRHNYPNIYKETANTLALKYQY